MARSTTINGSSVQITDDQVFLATRSHKPERITTYAVLVNETVWPPIQLITLATGVPGTSGGATSYNSHTALKALNDLGFDTFERVEHDLSGNVVVRDSRKRG